jgi:hypothetical protein
MPRVTHVAQEGTGKYPVLASIDPIVFTAATPADDEQTIHTGREVIIARNVSADTNYDVIITSAASSRTGRTGSLTYELAFGEQIQIGPLGIDGWKQSDGMLYFAGEAADIEFAVVRLSL